MLEVNPIWFFLTIVSVGGLCFWGGWYCRGDAVEALEFELRRLREQYLTIQGYTNFNGARLNYNLFSMDGGKIWYVVDYVNNQPLITGLAEDRYPGIIELLEKESDNDS